MAPSTQSDEAKPQRRKARRHRGRDQDDDLQRGASRRRRSRPHDAPWFPIWTEADVRLNGVEQVKGGKRAEPDRHPAAPRLRHRRLQQQRGLREAEDERPAHVRRQGRAHRRPLGRPRQPGHEHRRPLAEARPGRRQRQPTLPTRIRSGHLLQGREDPRRDPPQGHHRKVRRLRERRADPEARHEHDLPEWRHDAAADRDRHDDELRAQAHPGCPLEDLRPGPRRLAHDRRDVPDADRPAGPADVRDRRRPARLQGDARHRRRSR